MKFSRRWFYKFLSVEVALFRSHCGASFGISDGNKATVHASIPGFAIWVTMRIWKHGEWDERELSLRFHSGAAWWTIWRNPMGEWSRKVPRWRDGNFNFVDFILGDSVCTRRVIETHQLTIPMPERAYPASASLVEYTWRRPRWFAQVMLRAQIEVPEGIPCEGKGENSWDCGTDATYGITTGRVRSIGEGVGVLVGSVLHDRIKHGGWKDWHWYRVEKKEAQL